MTQDLKDCAIVKKDALAVILKNLKIPLSSGDTKLMEFTLYENCVSDLKKALAQDLKDCVILHKDSFNRLLHLARQDKMWPTQNEIADIEEEALAHDPRP